MNGSSTYLLRMLFVIGALVLHAWLYVEYQAEDEKSLITAGNGSATLSVSFSFVQSAEASMVEAARKPKVISKNAVETEAEIPPKETVTGQKNELQARKLLPQKVEEIVENATAESLIDEEHPSDMENSITQELSPEPLSISETSLTEPHSDNETLDDALINNETSENISISASTQQVDYQGVHDEIISDPSFSAPPQPPVYPKLARKRGQEGVVWLDVWLDGEGNQVRLEVFDSSGIDSLDSAAVKAVTQWAFLPRKLGALTVASHIRIPVEFALN